MQFRKPGKYNRFLFIKKNDLILVRYEKDGEYGKYLFLGFDKTREILELVPILDSEDDLCIKAFIHKNNIYDIKIDDKQKLLWLLHLKNKYINEAVLTIKNIKRK